MPRVKVAGPLKRSVMQTQSGIKVEDEGRGSGVHCPCNWEAGSAERRRGRAGPRKLGKGSGTSVVSGIGGRNGSSCQSTKQGCSEGERSLHNRRLQWTGHTGSRVGGRPVSRGKLVQWQG